MVLAAYISGKTFIMEYRIEYDKVMAIVEEEVSREAAQAASADGVALYDGMRMVSRDEDKKRRMMSEVLAVIKAQCNRFLKRAEVVESDGEPASFVFELDITPRRRAGKEESLQTLFRSLSVNLVLNRFFASKNLTDLAAKYDSFALADIQMMTKLLYEKLPPVYPQI